MADRYVIILFFYKFHFVSCCKSIIILGKPTAILRGNQLPSNIQMLRYFFYLLRVSKTPLQYSAEFAAISVIEFWNTAHIPSKRKGSVVKQILKMYTTYRNLQKSRKKNMKSTEWRQKVSAFIAHFDDLFDIAQTNVMNLLTDETLKKFLINQRNPGRKGGISYTDTRKPAQQEVLKENVTLNSSASSYASVQSAEYEPQKKRAKALQADVTGRNFLSKHLADSLDYHKVGHRAASELLTGLAATLDVDACTSRDFVRRKRIEFRGERATNIIESFQPNGALIVHWNGKMIFDEETGKKVDRLSISVTGHNVSKLLACPKLPSGSGENQAVAVHAALNQWNVAEKIKGMCFDTTSSNTGDNSGACVLLEHKLNAELLALACRHHIPELVIGVVFESTIETQSKGPNITIFERFSKAWPDIDKSNYRGLEQNDMDKYFPMAVKQDLVNFINSQLNIDKDRKDYDEFLSLALLILGEEGHRPNGKQIKIKKPGAISRARWMAKLIYSFKIYLFRDQFSISGKIVFLLNSQHFVKWKLVHSFMLANFQMLMFIQNVLLISVIYAYSNYFPQLANLFSLSYIKLLKLNYCALTAFDSTKRINIILSFVTLCI